MKNRTNISNIFVPIITGLLAYGCASAESASCKLSSDCKDGLICQNNICVVNTCINGIHDGDEADVDCGKICEARCVDGKRCNENADCTSDTCVDHVCTPSACPDPGIGDLLITEILNNVSYNSKFDGSNTTQMEFIELYNQAATSVFLKHLSIICEPTTGSNGEKVVFELPDQCLQAHGAIILSKAPIPGLPNGVMSYSAFTNDNTLTDTATYQCNLMLNGYRQNGKPRTLQLHSVIISNSKSGISDALNPMEYYSEPTDLYHHNEVNPLLKHSPGYCTNGSLFANACASHCENQIQDSDETDVDCGGTQCRKCGNQKKCKSPQDCSSGICNQNLCEGTGCTDDDDCEFMSGTCDLTNNICISCSDGIKNGSESDVDCGGPSCEPCEIGKKCSGDNDCQSNHCNSGTCDVARCSAVGCEIGQVCDTISQKCHSCSDEVQNGDESDVDCGGASCNPCKVTDKCNNNDDCQSKNCNNRGVCDVGDCAVVGCKNGFFCDVTSHSCHSCSDEEKNGDESDVDCGGTSCESCDLDQKCNNNDDCQSKNCNNRGVCDVGDCAVIGCGNGQFCDIKSHSCHSCSDNQTNGDESDKDCGGVACEPCAIGLRCNKNDDCQSLNCNAGHCDVGDCSVVGCEIGQFCDFATHSCYSCNDGERNGKETDTDCGGNQCDKCTNGKSCQIDSDCLSDYCESGTCKVDPCIPPVTGDLVIDEAFNTISTNAPMSNYDPQSTQLQAEYIEIVNLTNKQLSLKGISLIATRTDNGNRTSYQLSGCVPPKQAIIVSGSTIAGMPSGVVNIIRMNESYALTNQKPYQFQLVASDQTVLHTFTESTGATKSAISRVLPKLEYTSTPADVVDHNILNPDLKHSPGYCTNGGLFTNGCIAPCLDGIKNHSETDVDCGGSCGATCAYGKSCAQNSDCISGNCEPLTFLCGFDQCHNNKQDGDETAIDCGGTTCDPCSNGLSCLTDADCLSDYCNESKFCAYDPCSPATAGDLVIDEVMNQIKAGDPMSNYDPNSTQLQAEFIEIVNLSNKPVSLRHMAIQAKRTDTGAETKIPLSGCVPAKQAVVVSGSAISGMPAGVVNIIALKESNALTNGKPYQFQLVSPDNTVLHTFVESIGTSKYALSRVIPTLEYKATPVDAVDHNTINTALMHSPGYCTNGKRFIDECK